MSFKVTPVGVMLWLVALAGAIGCFGLTMSNRNMAAELAQFRANGALYCVKLNMPNGGEQVTFGWPKRTKVSLSPEISATGLGEIKTVFYSVKKKHWTEAMNSTGYGSWNCVAGIIGDNGPKEYGDFIVYIQRKDAAGTWQEVGQLYVENDK